jgi:hypothetical protein
LWPHDCVCLTVLWVALDTRRVSVRSNGFVAGTRKESVVNLSKRVVFAGLLTALPCSQVAAQTAAATARAGTQSCPYSLSELRQVLGLHLDEAKPGTERPFDGGRALSCHYSNKDLLKPSMWLNQVAADKPDDPSLREYFMQMAGKMDMVPGDPDQAAWQTQQGDLSSAALHYLRKGTQVEARLTIGPKDAQYEEVRRKLLKLRRIP